MYRDKSSMGNRLAPQKSKYDEDEERRKAMMRKLSGSPGKTSSGMY